MRGMRHCVVDQPGELGMRDQHTERVEDYGRSVLSGALRVDPIAELIELEVCGDDTAHLPLQRRAHGDHRCTDAERGVGRRNESPVRLHCVAIPDPLARIITIVPQIELLDLVTVFVFEDPPHRQGSAGCRTDEIDVIDGSRRRPEFLALRPVENVEAPDLQPAAVVVGDIEAVRLRQFVQRRFKENARVVDLGPVVRIGKSGIGRQHPDERTEL